MTNEELLQFDKNFIWHPYSSVIETSPSKLVTKAEGRTLYLNTGEALIDGMSSWWSVIHGYANPQINKALKEQIDNFSHVMFGGLTHKPAIKLSEKLKTLTPEGLNYIFFSDSGSVSIEVAMKMALQFHAVRDEPHKNKFLTIRGGYHGDTIGAMSVCDPVTGMHSLFSDYLPAQLFADKPRIKFSDRYDRKDSESFDKLIDKHHKTIAAVILEPIVQGAGGMWFYHPNYLVNARRKCDDYGIPLIADEIATGFGRTGKLFGCEHANITADIICIGKALTGGYMSLAATITTEEIANTLSTKGPKAFMHGPTFMANPLACVCALESLRLLISSNWQKRIEFIEKRLKDGLQSLEQHESVKDVRVLGAIGVVQVHKRVDLQSATAIFTKNGAWLRPFNDLIYIMPAYNITGAELDILIRAINSTVREL